MSIQKIEKDLCFPMERRNMKRDRDFKVNVKIGGGKKTAVVEFQDWKTMNKFEDELQKIANREDLKLELLVVEKKAA